MWLTQVKYDLIKVAPVFPGLKCNLHGDHV